MRIGFGLAAGLMFAAIAPAAGAECFAPGQARQPTKGTFADGAKVEVLERTAQALRYKFLSSPTAKPVEMKTFGGLFTLFADTGAGRYEFDWRDDLAPIFPLKVGQKASATANIEGNPPRTFAITIEVAGAETLKIGDCSYQVLKIIQTSGDVGKGTATITRFFNVESWLTLRTERTVPATATDPEKVIGNQMVELE
jgi:hypothetical protein